MSDKVQKGNIVLVPFPFTDMTDTKIRPALVIYVGKRDATVVFISSKVPNFVDEAQVVVSAQSPSFEKTGLLTNSVIKLDKIATIDKSLIYGELGEIDDDLRQEINRKISEIYRL